MSYFSTLFRDRQSLTVTALAAGFTLSGAASAFAALPLFTFDPSGVGLVGAAFTADNIVLSDYATIELTPNASGGANFTDNGILAVSAFEIGASPIAGSGLNSTYGLYFEFSGIGTQTTPGLASNTTGVFTSLNYTLYGYNVTGQVSYVPSDVTPMGVVDPIALATGTLISGGVGATTIPGIAIVPNANSLLNFAPTAAGLAFFASPSPFYDADFAAFTNNPSQVAQTGSSFVITQGGGSANFINIPEPASFAMLGAGLLGLGLTQMRRRTRRI